MVESIANALAGCSGVCEIGPGPGVLTSAISKQVQSMIALELDERMISALKESAPNVDARKADAMEVDLAAVLQELPEPRGIVSNLPYYITGPLVNRIADARAYYSVAVLMMQKEVAQRICSKPGQRERGSLSVYLQSLFEISVVAQAPASVFVPPPKVDSTVLKFVPKTDVLAEEIQSQLNRVVRFGFVQPRKTLANNLVAAYRISREEIVVKLEELDLEEKIRPHDLTLDQWIALSSKLPLK